ncbi:MAG: DNA-directed RNA polymerase subunit beta' [Erysipelotrichaceae bacterium]|jgi:DNA-directed RNA polymerase subunit beta'|nr:DNA-directed RNA polymerase subunit beta' [Erysipelotrichaceae bacterium]
MFDIKNLKAVKVGLASPETIRSWSHGEVTKGETMDYKSQKPKLNGLFCERIFGCTKDYECECGKLKKPRDQGKTCEWCGVTSTVKDVRRDRMGHIELASPCSHIWYLKGTTSSLIGLLLNIQLKKLEKIIYYAAHIVLHPGNSTVLEYKQYLDENSKDPKISTKILFKKVIETDIKPNVREDDFETRAQIDEYLDDIQFSIDNPDTAFDFISIADFISEHTKDEKGNGAKFGEGAAAIKVLLSEVDFKKEFETVTREIEEQKYTSANSTKEQKTNKLTKRLEVIKAFYIDAKENNEKFFLEREKANRPEWMILDVIPVIPPDARPMLPLDGGRFAASDLNELYQKVIHRNEALKKLIERKSPDILLNNARRGLQEAVDALIDNGRRDKSRPALGSNNRPLKSLTSTLKGKQGRFRQNLLGKRVDFSGRSVIAVGPNLKMYQCGIPYEMAILLLRPFISAILMKEKYVNSNKKADEVIDKREEIVFDIIERIISEHPVLLNRAPTLHRLSIQAFQPVLVEGRAIRLHPLVCAGFNADFDGDQMAVHVPISKLAQEEAVNLMLSSRNILSPSTGRPIVSPSQDMVLGNYYLTLENDKQMFLDKNMEAFALAEGRVFKDIKEVYYAYDTKTIHLHSRVAILGKALLKDKGVFTAEEEEMYLLTSVGKIFFNNIFPTDFPYIVDQKDLFKSFHNAFVPKGTDIRAALANKPLLEPFGKKVLTQIIQELFSRYGAIKTSVVVDKIKDQGFKFSTLAGITVAFSDIKDLGNFKESILKEGDEKVARINFDFNELGVSSEIERHNSVINVWTETKEKVEKQLEKILNDDSRNPLTMMMKSGARGSMANFIQLSGMRGLMAKPNGDTIEIPIKSSFREGEKVSEFFYSTYGARKGGADTALKTANSGYLTRRLADVAQDIVITKEDCGTDRGFLVKTIMNTKKGSSIVELKERLIGRYTSQDVIHPTTGEVIIYKNSLISEERAKRICNAGIKEVWIRSVLTCEAESGICKHCYGLNLAEGKEIAIGDAVGIMAAQSIGEPGTQLTMRTFHTGGVAGEADITQGLPRIQELFEIPQELTSQAGVSSKKEAQISRFEGHVSDMSVDENGNKIIVVKAIHTDLVDTFVVDKNATLRVQKVGEHVDLGGKITEGAISPKKLLRIAGATITQKYLIKEVQKVYRDQKVDLSDKHIEIIIRQMFKKVKIIDAGETDLVIATLVDKVDFDIINRQAIINGKRPAVCEPAILRISDAASKTKSFLSSASFQVTTRALAYAAISGKIDTLRGLKENVITGKLIPAGRGLDSEVQRQNIISSFDAKHSLSDINKEYSRVKADETSHHFID